MQATKQFAYLQEVAEKYGNFYLASDFQGFLQSASSEQLQELGVAYEALARRGDSCQISRFIDDSFRWRADTPYDEYKFSQQLRQLLLLFAELGKARIAPFSSGEGRYIEARNVPNWQNLPDRLEYLKEPAELYGKYCSESEILQFLDRATSQDFERLAQTAEVVRMNGDQPLIEQWFIRFPIDKHQEAWLLYWLFGVLDHAGLTWE